MSCGNSRSSKCNPCGPSEAAMNEIANKAAYYARIAQYASDGFSQVYLGAKDVAPTTDNTGNPLIVGALYFNTVSDILYVWDGSVWDVATNFNETTPFLSTGSTTARTLANRFADVVNVKDFGAVGDGVADDTAAIQVAVAASNGRSIYLPFGTYKITDTINISGKKIYGDNDLKANYPQTLVKLSGTFNKPAFYSNAVCTIEGFWIEGNATTLTTNQSSIKIESANDCRIVNMGFSNGFNAIEISQTCFYTTIDSCRWYNSKGPWIKAVSNTSQGIDLFISNCRGTSVDTDQNYGLYFEGLGSLIMSDCQFAPCYASISTFHVENLASLAGVQLISNSAFGEGNGYGIYLKCTSLLPARYFQFSNCYIAGTGSSVRIDYGYQNSFENTYFTGNNYGINCVSNVIDTVFDSCIFQTTNVPFVGSPTISKISAAFTDCFYSGSFPFVYLPGLSDSQINYITARGGYFGLNANPIQLPSINTKQDISVFGSNYGPIQRKVYTGTMNSSGVADITHGITNGNSRIVLASAFWKGGSSEAYPLTISYIDSGIIRITGVGSQNAKYRLYVEFFQETISW
jgi:hypothetical protein